MWYPTAMRSALCSFCSLVGACASAPPPSPPTVPLPCPTIEVPADPHDAYLMSLSLEHDSKSESFTEVQEKALKAAVRACWEKTRGPDSAGLITVELLRIEPDGSLRLGGPNWTYPRIFAKRFFGAEDTRVGNALSECTRGWLETQKYPGVRELRASFRLLPAH